ncbi:acyl-CoA dehydrogenase family protein [Raoultella ornithinolytica]
MLNPSATLRAEKTPYASNSEFSELLDELKKRSEEFEQQRYISDDIISRFKQAGVYRALVPTQYGGDEISPAEFCQLIETIATADGSAGWVASFGMNPFYLGGLPLSTLDEIYRHGPDVVFAGGIFPPQKAIAQDGGFQVSGRWSFASGCTGAELIGVGILPDDGSARPLPRIAVLPADRFTIDPVWNTVIM